MVILGGVCGLYAGLTALRKGYQVILLEKDDQPGGLAAGLKRGGNFYDQGVHMLHAHDREIYEDIAGLMGEERVPVTLDARILWNNRSYRYPLRGLDILAGMNPLELLRCSVGLVLADVANRLNQTQADAKTAEEALIATYGAPLYEFFFEEFTHRYWNLHPRQLSAEFVRRKMPRLNVLDLLKNCLPKFLQRRSKDLVVESALTDETLHYSATGSETLPRVMAAEIERLGGKIHYGVRIQEVGARLVKLEEGDLPYDLLLSTIPLPEFVRLNTSAPAEVREAAARLTFKPIATYGLLVLRERCLEGLYTYYRNRIFHRVGEPSNAALEVTPEGHTVLIVEMTCDRDDPKWNDAEEIRQTVSRDLEIEGICDPDEIVEWHHFTNPHGYPIYRLHFEKDLERVRSWLDGLENIESTGRQGGFTYPGMHQAMRMGQVAVDELCR